MPRNNNAPNGQRALTDEELARALQRQYEREQQQQQQQQRQSRSPNRTLYTAPRSASRPSPRRSASRGRRQQSQQQSSSAPPPPHPHAPLQPVPAMSDEEYARHLQREEERARASAQRALSRRQQERDNRRSQQQQQSQYRGTMVPIPSAPVETASMRGQSTRGTTTVVHMSDAELAQQIMAQERAEAAKAAKNNVTPLTSRESSLVSVSQRLDSSQQQELFEDEELAMRMEQEFRDEEIARRIQSTERDRIAAQHAQAAQRVAPQEQQAPKKACSFRRCCSFLFSFILLGGAAAGMIYYFLIMGNDLPDWIPTPQDFANEDPFDAKKPSDANAWQNDGKGITLEVLNALDDYWYPYFNQAVRDWDNGYPDALTLMTSVRDVEPDCQTVNGKVKVCNGNYGNTHWKGINEVLIDRRGQIFASSARMNEYYLGGAPNGGDPDQMQYTMCHEIGHAWGLPHTDESFTNKDLGNCMDYTNNPENNKTPDLSNYQFLHALYGLVPGAAPYTAPTMAPTTANELTSAAAVNNDFEDENDGPPQEKKNKQKSDKDGHRRRRVAQVHEKTPDEPLADWLQASVDAAKAKLEAVVDVDYASTATAPEGGGKRWRLLQQSPHGESHEIELEKGYRFQVHKLYP